MLSDLNLDSTWMPKKIFNNIFEIDNDNMKWIVKIYNNKRHLHVELNRLKKLKHIDNIPKVLASFISNKINYIIMSKADGTDLFNYTHTNDNLSEEDAKHITRKLLYILNNIHKENIIHGDIKPENIIYDEETKNITLIDFENKHTSAYCSPEQILGKRVTYKTDIWSFGITLYYLLIGNIPFQRKSAILNDDLDFDDTELSDLCVDFLSKLLVKNEKKRISINDALNHKWLS